MAGIQPKEGFGLDSDIELLGHQQAVSISHFASLQDFHPWQEIRPVDMREVLLSSERAQRTSPYCICPKKRCIVLVELPSTASYTDPGALFFEMQRRRAQRVYCIPFHRAVPLAQALATRLDFGRMLLLFNTGRCGSNLLSAALSEFQGVCSISEPDVFAPLYVPVPDQADVGSAEAASQLVWAASVLLLHWAERATPGFRLLAVKTRSRLAGDMISALRALPGAHAAMLYRRFLPTMGSMAVAFRPRPSQRCLLTAICAAGLDPLLYCLLWLLQARAWRELVDMPVVAGAKPPVPAHVLWRCGHLAVHAVKLINSLEQARRAHEQGLISFCITYEGLVRHRETYLRQVLAACLPPHSSSGSWQELQSGKAGPQDAPEFPLRPGACLERVFAEDQHQGRLVSCSGGPSMWRAVSQGCVGPNGLSRAQASRLEELRRWLQPGQQDADELLPGTLLPA